MTSPTDDRLRRSFDYAADVESIAIARDDAVGFVGEQLRAIGGLSDEQIGLLAERLRLVVSELCTNAVEAAPDQGFRLEIRIMGDSGHLDFGVGDGSSVRCTVVNPDPGDGDHVPRFGLMADPLAERGRGLAIVDGIADRSWVDQAAGLTMVTAELVVGSSV